MSRQEWFESLFQQYGDMIFRYCALHTNDLQDAQDIFQEVFLKLYKKNPAFNTQEHAKAWLLRVSINLCKNYHRARILHPWIEYDDSLHVKYANRKKEPDVLLYLRRLPHHYQSILYLYYFEGYSLREIATLCNKNEGTIRTWIFRVRKKLQEEMEEEK